MELFQCNCHVIEVFENTSGTLYMVKHLCCHRVTTKKIEHLRSIKNERTHDLMCSE